MIHLSGLEVKNIGAGDIEIQITGLRPGEKLYEELLVGNNATGTTHPRIMASKEKMLAWSELELLLSEIDASCKVFNPKKVRQLLLKAPTDFSPSDELCDILM